MTTLPLSVGHDVRSSELPDLTPQVSDGTIAGVGVLVTSHLAECLQAGLDSAGAGTARHWPHAAPLADSAPQGVYFPPRHGTRSYEEHMAGALESDDQPVDILRRQVASFDWFHSIDFGRGV